MFFGYTDGGKTYRIIYGHETLDVPVAELKKDRELRKQVDALEHTIRCNPLRYFVPSGNGVEFLNDTGNDVKLIVAPNGVGKTTHMIIDIVLSAIPCDPEWEIFTKHGVKCRQWEGKKKVIIATYQTSLHKQTIWPELQKWIPEDQLQRYGKYWPYKTKREPSWKDNPIIKLKCGTEIALMTYSQDQQAYESFAADIIGWDEQGKECLFDGADERVRRRSGRHVFALTPHKVQGRPDTGWGSWIHKLATGEKTKGHNIGEYFIGIDDVPDYVYPKKKREAAYKKWVTEPEESGDLKSQQEGRSRYYGEWHRTSGLVYDEIVPEVHFIEPFDITEAFTLYRGLDHGTNNPTACLMAAVDKDGFIYLFDEYYQRGRTISQNVRAIVEQCGNRLEEMDSYYDEAMGYELKRFEEQYDSMCFAKSVLDSRSFATTDAGTGRPTGWLYRACGLLVQPASGKFLERRIPMVKELLRINPDLKNPITGEMGSPRMFIFNTLRNFRTEWMGYVWEEHVSGADGKNLKEKPRAKDDHLMNCLEYLAQIPMRFLGDFGENEKKCFTADDSMNTAMPKTRKKNRTTGY